MPARPSSLGAGLSCAARAATPSGADEAPPPPARTRCLLLRRRAAPRGPLVRPLRAACVEQPPGYVLRPRGDAPQGPLVAPPRAAHVEPPPGLAHAAGA